MTVIRDPDSGNIIALQQEVAFHVKTWCSDADGKHPEQVHLEIPYKDLGMDTLVRFTGPVTLNRLVDALIDHAEGVWGPTTRQDAAAEPELATTAAGWAATGPHVTPFDGVVAWLEAERGKQRKQWGDAHDDAHTPIEWLEICFKWLARAMETTDPPSPAPEYQRERTIVKTAAVLVAWLEAMARAKPPEASA